MMNMVNPRPQPINGQRRQQCPPGDASSSGAYPPVPTSTAATAGNFFPPESQGAFTFSAEPTPIVYDGSLTTIPSSGQESAFTTPNADSSFDSSLHPDMINPSFPPPNTYMSLQQHYSSLSPASHSRNGNSISPSHSVDHLSPEAGYLSDPSYQDLSNYTTPTFNGQYLDESFSNLTFSDNMAANGYVQYQGENDMSLLTHNSLNTYNAQPPTLPSNGHLDSSPMLPRNQHLDSHSQLISPGHTNNSSPIGAEDQTPYPPVLYNGNNPTAGTPPNQAAQTMHSTPIKQTQSPALTNSPGSMPVFNPQPRTHLASPIVRVENCSREESPSRSDHSRPMSKRSHGSRRSGNHLSPYPQDESSDEDEVQQDQSMIHPAFRTTDITERNEDGSWLTTGTSGQAGLNPDDRQAMGDAWVPTIEEIAEHRKKEEKKIEVREWLTKSEVGSEAGDGNASGGLLRPTFVGRRRAKSTNDANRHGYDNSFGLGLRTDFDRVDDSGIPGPGRYIDEPSEYDDYDDDEEDAEPESPPAAIDYRTNNADNTDVSYFPPVEQPGASGGLIGAVIRPWIDEPSRSSMVSSTRYQPPTSNAAMMRFRLRARDVESASLAATVGSRRSRRLSESDLGSVRGGPGVIKVIQPDPKRGKERQRRPSFLENILPKRTPSNLLKRKGSIPVQQPEGAPDKPKEPIIERPKRIGSWGRPKSPRLDTNVAPALGPPSATNLSATSGPWYQGAKNAIRRSRSRSDLGKSPGLKELMTQHGGPPMPMLASPMAETEATAIKYSPQPSPLGDDDDEDGHEPITMDLKVRSDPIIPTFEGFKTHARQLNPRLSDYMVERITQEQMRRYKRLLEFRVKHLNAVRNGNCSSGSFCTALGGEAKQLPPRAGNKDSDAPFIGFQITAPGSSDDDGEPPAEGTVVSAQFPSGVPLPPVKRLPAEFECPLCFKVKKFYKPSDWTKHVHEDVQPFTCTFPNCGEPKSFKRKADWVRHENERHRQLENWTCQLGDCNHTCYRKDNFVQHLVREHKIAEPRGKTGRAGNKDASGAPETEDIWSLVERCRRDTTKQPKDEPCRFCGNICNSWKKLTVHLAKHMEQISMPILPLVDQKQMNADTIISPVVEIGEGRKHLATPTRSPIDNPSRYNPKVNSTLAPGIDPYGQFPQDTSPGAASNIMHTYPPPQMVAYKAQPPPPPPKNYSANYPVENAPGYPSQTYPGLQEPPKRQGAYVNPVQIPNQGYHNGDMHNGQNGFPMTPISAVTQSQQQQQPPVFTTSPVDTTSYQTAYFTQEPQNMTHDVAGMGFNVGDGMQFQQPTTYQDMSYMTTQGNYQYQGH